MSTSRLSMRPPRKILLATDLGSHCDRALDRAAQLARQWQAALHVVHALQPQAMDFWMQPADDVPRLRDSDVAAAVERQVRRDLREEADELVVHVTAGDPAQVIADTAARNECELIVLGAEGATLAGSTLGSTAAQLLRKSPISVLIVKARPHDAYRHVLVGTDFTIESRHGLAAAAAWFPDAGFDLMHALDIPYKSLFLEAGRSDEFARLEKDTIESFVASAKLPEYVRQGLRTHVEHGHPRSCCANTSSRMRPILPWSARSAADWHSTSWSAATPRGSCKPYPATSCWCAAPRQADCQPTGPRSAR